MIRLSRLLLAGVVLSSIACDKTRSTNVPKVDMPSATESKPLATSSNAFAFDLWARIASRPGNLAASPASISAALCMTWAGAKGPTEQEMRRVLHLGGDAGKVAVQWGKLSLALQNPSRPLELRIANRLFGEKSFKFEEPFLDLTKSAFAAPLEPVDFRGAADPSRRHINSWVEGQTEHRIKDLLPPESIKDDTRMVLVNAIYFLAQWATQFKHEATSPRPFSVAPGTQKTVPTMHMMNHLRLAQGEGATMLELPYVGGDTAMLVVLPDRPDGLANLEAGFSPAKLAALDAALASQSVAVALPQFEIDPKISLSLGTELRGLGMRSAFDAKAADFSGIGVPPNPQNRLYISEVFHKAFVKVNEKGTEAAAATAVVAPEGAGAPPKATPFVADHPFLFFIVDKPSGLILFIGRVADPSVH